MSEQKKKRKPEPPFPANEDQSPPGSEADLDPSPRWRAPAWRGSGKLEGRRALVTGGDSGIGRSVAALFAREGADVAIVALPEEREDAEVTAEAVRGEGRRAHVILGDLREPEFCASCVDRAADELGGLDLLVNNAAFQNHVESIEELDLEQWRRTFSTNIEAYFLVAKAALRHMKRGASIINTGSITGLEGSPGLLDYSATKGAIHAFTKSLAGQLVGRGIRVNCVAPGPVWTPLNPAERGGEETKEFGADTPMGRPAQPEEIAPAYIYFASELSSSYVTGEILTLLGGETRAG